LKAKKIKTKAKVYVIPILIVDKSIEIAQKLRQAGINTDLDLMKRKVNKNLEYVNKMQIPYVIFVGEQELQQGKIKLRNMQTGREDLLTVEETIEYLQKH